ncbi:tRNA A37 threonylcarbamoyladenosine dehydratase [Inhella inkyongensis]|uniref:tRNA A37 threonylcarbamoyladenosine dehydratase n=1 Tax=Inhella inkyongensis TaxID=392593 RepID=A0A840RYK0_9BURK|nr:tRNA threonylcarbamoyladenosine dehydratase [Inhella inkyongensis]MBB5203817.1 tRNA A37 threonylcarbamoyladenosine dehydratase [Inhella inkyongensis]
MSEDDDLERRFGGLRRLYGEAAYRRLRGLHVAVVGLGGVGSWSAEALARSGVAALTLIDLDHVAESNINRQVQALQGTLGQHKGEALRERIEAIHPGCKARVIDAFVEPDNWPGLLEGEIPDGLIDACDQVRAKLALAVWARGLRLPFVSVGAAGGKRQAQAIEVADLADTTHDPLLASLRAGMRREGGAPRQGKMGIHCVFSREAVQRPQQDGEACAVDGSLNCAGYGSSVVVTASFGMTAAGSCIEQVLKKV